MRIHSNSLHINSRQVHSNWANTSFQCYRCDNYFRYIEDCMRHMSIPYTTNLLEHIPRHIGNVSLVCNHCGKKFVDKNAFIKHNKEHLQIASQTFACTYQKDCKKYRKQENLELHILRHKGQEPIECTYLNCGKKFTRISNLKSHNLSTHTNEISRLWQAI